MNLPCARDVIIALHLSGPLGSPRKRRDIVRANSSGAAAKPYVLARTLAANYISAIPVPTSKSRYLLIKRAKS